MVVREITDPEFIDNETMLAFNLKTGFPDFNNSLDIHYLELLLCNMLQNASQRDSITLLYW
jgi:hypothetical protein